MDTRTYWGTADIAKHLGVPVSRAYNWWHRGLLPDAPVRTTSGQPLWPEKEALGIAESCRNWTLQNELRHKGLLPKRPLPKRAKDIRFTDRQLEIATLALSKGNQQ